MAALSHITYKSYTGEFINLSFVCAQCGSTKFYRHKRDYKLTHFEGHYHCIQCNREVDYCDDDFIKTVNIGILYDYKPFKVPKIGEFKVTTDEYDHQEMKWKCVIEQGKIIGETKNTYVIDLRPTEQGEWVGETVVKVQSVLPLGYHKSRLVKWVEPQLQLAI